MKKSRPARRSAENIGSSAYCPDEGDLIWLDFTPQAGNEQAGRRPALVISPRAYNAATRRCFVCPITTRVKGYPFEVPLPAGLSVTGVVLADHLKNLSWAARKAEFIGRAPGSVVAHVRAMLKPVTGI